MWPILVDVGPSGAGEVSSYLVFVLAAFGVGCLWVHWRSERVGIDLDRLPGLYAIVGLTGFAGARLLHFVGGEWPRFVADPTVFLDPKAGGLAFLGGVGGGLLGGTLYARWAGLPVWKLADAVSVALMLGLGLGRLGCFSAGCCHGRLCPVSAGGRLLELPGGEVWWLHGLPGLGLRFDSGAVAGQLVYPTQLMESLGAFLLAAFLHRMTRRWRRFDGQVLAAMMGSYGLLRLGIEGLRGDGVRGVDHLWLGSSWTTGELSSFALWLGAVAIVVARRGAGVAQEAPLPPPPAVEEDGDLADDLLGDLLD